MFVMNVNGDSASTWCGTIWGVDYEYAEAVLDLVERIPPGRAMSYGAVADMVGAVLDRGGPRQVGMVMARYGGGVPWWRVVTASGRLPPGHEVRALRELTAEGTPMTRDGDRIDIRRAVWHPEPDDHVHHP